MQRRRQRGVQMQTWDFVRPSEAQAPAAPANGVRSPWLWALGLHLTYCALILIFHWRAGLPPQFEVLIGLAVVLSCWLLSRAPGDHAERTRCVLVGLLTPLACMCWGAVLSPFNLFMMFGSPIEVSRMIVLGLGPWILAWAIAGPDFRSYLSGMRRRLVVCGALTWLLFLIPHVLMFGVVITTAVGVSLGWATYLATLTGILLANLGLRMFAYLDDAVASGRLSRVRAVVLETATGVILLLLAFPPWTVTEQVWGATEPGVQLLSVDRNARGHVYAENYGLPDPRYGLPHPQYEPWYMCYYRGPVDWVAPDISGPERLRRIPQTSAERVHVRYTQPNRRLSLAVGRWAIGPAVVAGLAAGLCAVLGRKTNTAT
jgi:hypothetical protein